MIRVQGLAKYYGSLAALKGVSLRIFRGELFGLLGPNGAGKTTLLRILTTLTRPQAGRVNIAGSDINRDLTVVKKIIGVVPQHNNLDQELTVEENMALGGMLYGLKGASLKTRLDELLTLFQLQEKKRVRAKVLSGGENRRVMMARALMHRPELLFLDEPTVGLDPLFRKKIWSYIKRLHAQGMTILLTTHYIEEAEALCSKIGLLNGGRLVALDTAEVLIGKVGSFTMEYFDEEEIHYRYFRSRQEALQYTEKLTGQVTVRKTNLEDVFISLTNRKVR